MHRTHALRGTGPVTRAVSAASAALRYVGVRLLRGSTLADRIGDECCELADRIDNALRAPLGPVDIGRDP